MSIITRQINSVEIGQRAEDGYVDLTKMGQAAGKLITDYLRLDSTKAFLEALSSDTGNPVTVSEESMGFPIVSLLYVKTGRNGGTWAHPQIAIHCAQWCSPQFAVLVSKWVFEWMTQGKTPVLKSEPQPQIAPQTITITPQPITATPQITSNPFWESTLAAFKPQQAVDLLSQVKPLAFMRYSNRSYVINEDLILFFEVELKTIRAVQTRLRTELKQHGFRTIKGKAVRAFRSHPRVHECANVLNVWTPHSVLLLALSLDSPIARQVQVQLLSKGDRTGKALPSQTATLYRRISEKWENRKAEKAPTPPDSAEHEVTGSSRSRLFVLDKAIALGEKLGGFDVEQRTQLKNQLLELAMEGRTDA